MLAVTEAATEPPPLPAMDQAEAAESKPKRRVTREDKALKIAIEQKLRRARTVLKSLRMMYGVLAIPMWLWVIVESVQLSEGTGGATVGSLAMALSFAILMLAGALFLFVHPLGFALAMACGATLFVGSNLVMALIGDAPFSAMLGVRIAGVIALWCAVGVIANIMKLKREYPDLIDTEKLKRRQRFDDAPVSAALARAEAKRSELRTARLKLFGWVAGAVFVVVIGAFGVNAAMSEEPQEPAGPAVYTAQEIQRIGAKLDPALTIFWSAWNRSDLDSIEAQLDPSRTGRFWRLVKSALRKRDWTDNHPPLDTSRDKRTGSPEQQDVWFEFERGGQTPSGGTLKTTWKWSGSEWQLFRIVFPKR